MKNKYITTQVLMACQVKKETAVKDIHAQISETLVERNRIMKQMQDHSRMAKVMDMYLEMFMIA
jgi:hypothetical protein